MARARPQFHTIYHVMDQKGIFDVNPANASAVNGDGQSIYTGPVEFPKMFYHPEGLERITVPAELIATPFGPKAVGEQRELISEVAATADDEARLRDAGWHDHPAKALTAAGKAAPMISPSSRIADLEAQIAKLQAERAVAQSATVTKAAVKPTAPVVPVQ